MKGSIKNRFVYGVKVSESKLNTSKCLRDKNFLQIHKKFWSKLIDLQNDEVNQLKDIIERDANFL